MPGLPPKCGVCWLASMRNALAALSADASVGNSSTYRLLTSGVCSFHQRWIPPAEGPNVGPTLPLFALRCADGIPERPGNRISRTAHRVKPSAEGSSRKDCPMSPLPEGSTSVRSCAHFCSPLRGDHRTPGSASYYPQARSWCFGSVMLIGLPFWKLPITSRFQPPATLSSARFIWLSNRRPRPTATSQTAATCPGGN
jgi:hypothetical protein